MGVLIRELLGLADEQETDGQEGLVLAAVDRIKELEAENQRMRIALRHVQFYALDNVPEELREMAKAVLLQEDKPHG